MWTPSGASSSVSSLPHSRAASDSRRTSESSRAYELAVSRAVSWWIAIWKWKLPAFVPEASRFSSERSSRTTSTPSPAR